MTPEQAARLEEIRATEARLIPAGSWLAVRRLADGQTAYLEIVEPEPRRRDAWDFGLQEPKS